MIPGLCVAMAMGGRVDGVVVMVGARRHQWVVGTRGLLLFADPSQRTY